MSPLGFLATVVALSSLLVAQVLAVPAQAHQQGKTHTPRPRVDFTLGVMSRCPDALFTETFLTKVIDSTNDKISLKMLYIGEIDADQEHGVKCKHGPQECAGNIQQLCMAHLLRPSRSGPDFDLSPSTAQRKVWDFIQCQNYDGIPNIGSLALAQQCTATVKGPRWEEDGLKKCIQGPKGRELLQDSVREAKRRGVTKSATIQIEGKTVCVRDDGAWKECQGGHEAGDFVKQIEDAFKNKNT